MATIKEIAKKANVSVATVSYVINETRYVSPKLKERVLNAIEELNYVPNAMARGLRAKSTKTFGLVLTDITNPFYPDLARGCEDKAKSLGYYVMMINTDEKEDVLLNAIKQLREGRLDGLIVASATKSHRKILKEVIDEGYPIVLAHRYLDNLNVDTVVEDNETGMTAAVRYLLSLGHREIHLMSGKDDSFVSKARKSYFFKAMEEAGIENIDEKIVKTDHSYEQGYDKAMKMMLALKNKRPTAVICINDMVALGVLDAVQDLRMSVPDDLSIVGFEDLFFSNSRGIQLTTVHVPRYKIGKRATELLVERIHNHKMKRKQIVLNTNLVIRSTCERIKTNHL